MPNAAIAILPFISFILFNVMQKSESCKIQRRYRNARIAAVCVLALAGALRAADKPTCDAANGGLQLPPGFCALVVADGLGTARHMAVAPNGEVFSDNGGTLFAEGGYSNYSITTTSSADPAVPQSPSICPG